MESILIHPSTEVEKTLIENLLAKMKIAYEKLSDDKIVLSDEEIANIEKGLEDFENGKTYTSNDVRKMMEECIK